MLHKKVYVPLFIYLASNLTYPGLWTHQGYGNDNNTSIMSSLENL